MTKEPESIIPIGTKAIERGHPFREYTVIDHLRTYNNAGELVEFYYVTEHEFMGQMLTDKGKPHFSIQMDIAEHDATMKRKEKSESREKKTASEKKFERAKSIRDLSRKTGLSVNVLQRVI